MFGLADELLPLANQLHGLFQLLGEAIPQRIHHLNGVLLVDEPSTAEGDATAFQHDLLELIKLVERGDGGLSHGCPREFSD